MKYLEDGFFYFRKGCWCAGLGIWVFCVGLKYAILVTILFKSLILQNLIVFHMICPSFLMWSELVTNSCHL